MTCISKNPVYCITCAGCNKYYTGQTEDCLRNRVTVHRQQINHPELWQIDLSGHLATCAKGPDPQFHIIPFFSYAIYLCFGLPPYFIGAYHRLIFLLVENGILWGFLSITSVLRHANCGAIAVFV